MVGTGSEHRCDDSGIVSAEADQGAGQADLDDADPPRHDRDRADDPDERPGGERLGQRYLRCRDVERAQHNNENREDAEAAHERRQP